MEGPQGQLSVPTLAKEPESCRRWHKTRVEEPQSQVRADTRTIEQTAKTDALGAPTPQPFPDCVSEGEETDHLLRVLSIQAVTRREARTACHGESQVKSQSDKSEQTISQDLTSLIQKHQPSDPSLERILKDLDAGLARKGYHVKDGLLFREKQIVVPQQRALIDELLHVYHDDELAGHWGRDKTLELLRRKFYWKTMLTDVAEYVATCPVCQSIDTPRHKPYGSLQPLPVPERPWKEISLDWIVSLPPSRTGTGEEFNSILVIVDRYTKMARFLPTRSDTTAPEFAELFHREIELKYGAPTGIVSDRDSKITSKFWAEVCYHALVKRRLSTAFHPQTDGQTEILNRILEHYLRAYTSDEQTNWARLLPTAEYSYNNSRSASTGISPFRAMYGYNPEIRFDVADDVPEGEIPAARDRIRRLQELREELRKKLVAAQERQKHYYDQRHVPKQFKRGDLVRLSTKNLRLKSDSKKLQKLWVGPFRVTERIGHSAYRLALPDMYSKLHDVFPIQALEQYHTRDRDNMILPMPPLEEDQEEWEVEEVVDKACIRKEIHYLVKWTGWPSEYNQWVPDKHMDNARDAIRKFAKSKKGRKAEEELKGPSRKAPRKSTH